MFFVYISFFVYSTFILSMKPKNTNEFYELKVQGRELSILFKKAFTLENSFAINQILNEKKNFNGIDNINLDFGNIDGCDSYYIIFLTQIDEICKKNDIQLVLNGQTQQMKSLVTAFMKKSDTVTVTKEKQSKFISYFEGIGSVIIIIFSDMGKFISFWGDLLLKLLFLIVQPQKMRWRDFPFHFTAAAVNAVPIVVLILFLIGVITGYQGALQLERFGADIFIANLVGVSISRELAPLMTAIIVAGRSGAAYAAEIGTMKVSEEIDALRSMGFDISRFIILPRIIAVVLAMPALTLLADFAGIGGGLLAAISTLNITVSGYLNQLQISLSFGDLLTGLGKSVIFGLLISTVGGFRGLQVRGGAESVGRYTTASVVTGIFLIILADAVFTFVFQALGI